MIIGQGANDMDFNLNFHPLDNLIKDKTSFYLEALVPFIDYKYKKYLIIYIKYKELTSLLDALEDITYVESCGFNCKAKSMDDVINGLIGFMPKDFSDNIRQMKSMIDMMSLMNTMEQSSGNTSATNNLSSIFSAQAPSPSSPNSHQHSNSFDSSCHNKDECSNASDDYNLLDSIMTILDQEQ